MESKINVPDKCVLSENGLWVKNEWLRIYYFLVGKRDFRLENRDLRSNDYSEACGDCRACHPIKFRTAEGLFGIIPGSTPSTSIEL